jgi:hypothetical protein
MRLRIKRWQEVFEQVGTTQRPKKSMRWFTRPCDKAHGVGSMALRSHPKGQMFRGIFDCCLEVSALLPVEMRGLVVRDDGTPHTAETLHIIHGGATVEDYREAIAFFLQPVIGWLIDEEAQQVAAQPSKVVTMPLPRIEEPSIYEAAAVRMLDRYANAGAPVDRMPDPVAISNAIWRKCGERANDDHESLIDLMEDNQRAYIASQAPKMLKTLDAWIAGGLSLATRKGPKVYERGTLEAAIQAEVLAGRITAEEAKEAGVHV